MWVPRWSVGTGRGRVRDPGVCAVPAGPAGLLLWPPRVLQAWREATGSPDPTRCSCPFTSPRLPAIYESFTPSAGVVFFSRSLSKVGICQGHQMNISCPPAAFYLAKKKKKKGIMSATHPYCNSNKTHRLFKEGNIIGGILKPFGVLKIDFWGLEVLWFWGLEVLGAVGRRGMPCPRGSSLSP